MTYCQSLTTTQVKNVLTTEHERMNKSEGEISKAARELYQEAREELLRRHVEPDLVLKGWD